MATYEDYYTQKKLVKLQNGDVYEGHLNGKIKHGYGTYRYANGDIY